MHHHAQLPSHTLVYLFSMCGLSFRVKKKMHLATNTFPRVDEVKSENP
jgi:hypothetical protein